MPVDVKLKEGANFGDWIEARIHMEFTCMADQKFGDGMLTRDERIAMSSAIGDALDAFRASLTKAAPQLYERTHWQDAPEPPEEGMMDEAANVVEGEFMPLLEGAVRRDGTIPVKLITPGWGATGYYPADVLERDGPKVFKAGTKMYWNHPTATEEAERPEGDLNALAAELVSDARWDGQGPKGPGLYADAKVFEAYQKPIDELAPHIGVSIRALGRSAMGEADGRKGPIIQGIAAAHSVDFVTKPGAGGQIVQMFEAARPRRFQSVQDNQEVVMSAEMQKQLKEAQDRLALVEQQNARLQEALLLNEARGFVASELGKTQLPDVTKARLLESLASNPVVKDGQLDKAGYATRIAEAVTRETEYLASVAGFGSGRIMGMGASASQAANGPDETAMQKQLNESFITLGLNEREAKHATAGHRW